MPRPRKPREIEVVDLFCEIGGLSYGLKTSGFRILAGYDLDGTCKYAYEHNNNSIFQYRDIKSVTSSEIKSLYSKDSIKVLAGLRHVNHSHPIRIARKKKTLINTIFFTNSED